MPLIKQESIEQTLARTDITEVIGAFVTLKTSGTSFQGLSPFTDEKTPSFYVVPSKNIYKCFSSGKGGNVVDFLMQLKGWSFPEAIKYLADKAGVELEYLHETEEQKSNREKAQLYQKMNLAARNHYLQSRMGLPADHPAQKQLQRFSEESLIEWQIGYTSDDAQFIYEKVKSKGHTQDAHNAGLLNQANGQYFDYFRKRIIFPVFDMNGNVVAFGGRTIEKEGKPKYLNSRNAASTWNKDHILYGVHKAATPIRQRNRAIITEGYTDVIALHEIGFSESVATLGSSNISSTQIQQLRRLCDTVIIMRDGDEAGQKSAIKDMERLLPFFRVQVCVLPVGKDPADIIYDEGVTDQANWINERITNALAHFASKIYQEAGDDVHAQSDAVKKISEWLGLIQNDLVRERYQKELSKLLSVRVSHFKTKKIDMAITEAPNRYKDFTYDFPVGVDANEAIQDGFYEIVDGHKTGYYFLSGKSFEKCSNFVITPVFHKIDSTSPTRIIKLDNGRDATQIIELPGEVLLNPVRLSQYLIDKGAYLWEGTKTQLIKIIKRHLYEFPNGYVINTLGWQLEGFFAYYNCIFNGKISRYDETGLVKHEGTYYFSPAASNMYQEIREEDHTYKNDKYLKYSESDITFKQWSELMVKAYGSHAFAGVPFVLVSLFRDLVFKVDSNCPFLYPFGPSRSGKSSFAASVCAPFFEQLEAFNLSSGTEFAFASRLSRFRNCPAWFNEFDVHYFKEERFNVIKSAYDGEGRERGKGTNKRSTEIQPVNSSVILTGQFLVTKDDNSIVSRSIVLPFKQQNDREESQSQAYYTLTDHQKKGISSILVELLQHRSFVEEAYQTAFRKNFRLLIETIKEREEHFEDRVVRNYNALFTMVCLLERKVEFPWSTEAYKGWIIDQIIRLSGLISKSDVLADFWETLELLQTRGELRSGTDFKVVETSQATLHYHSKKKKAPQIVCFQKPKKVLYLRLEIAQKLYAQQKAKERGIAMDKTSLTSYLSSREYYIGHTAKVRIEPGKSATSAYVFDMEAIGIDFSNETDLEGSEIVGPGITQENGNKDLPF